MAMRETGRLDDSMLRCAGCYEAFTASAAAAMTGPDQPLWLDRPAREYDNIRAVLRWALDTGRFTAALRLAASLWWFWVIRTPVSEGRQWIGEILRRTAVGEDHGGLAVDDARLQAKVLYAAAMVSYAAGDAEAAESQTEKCLELFRAAGDQRGEARALMAAALWALFKGDAAAARERAEQARALFVRHGDTRGTALSQGTLGIAAYRSGEFDAAGRLLTDSLQTLRSVGDRRGSALMLEALAKLNYAQGGYRRAAELAADSLELDRSSGERRGVATALLLLSGVAVQEARFSVAAKLLGAVERLVKEVGFTLSAPDRAMFDDLKAALERGMQADALRRGWSAGAAMPYDELLERALGYARRAKGRQVSRRGGTKQ